MSRVDTSSSGDESISPVASPKPTSSKPSSGLAIEPQAPARGRPTTRQATSRPPKRPDICSPSPARTQADSPASSYRSTRPAFPPIEKWTVASLRQALANSDIQAPRKFTKAELYELYKNPKPTTLSTKSSTKATRKRKHTASPPWTPPSSARSKTSSRRAPDSGSRPSASQGHAPDFADARPAEGPAAAQPYGTAFQSAMPVPTAQTGFWPPPPPLPAQQPTPFCPGPAAQVNAWSQWPAYVAPQPGPGPVAQTSTWLQWPPNPIPQPTPLSSGPVTQVDTGPQNTAPYAADNRQTCFAFNSRKCVKQRCRYLHICSFCCGAHARSVCPVYKAANKKYKNYLSTPVNIYRLATELTHHPDKDFREYLLSGLRDGFNPGVECALSQSHICNNLQSAHAEPAIVNELIEREVKAGFMIGPFNEPPFEVFRVSPIGIATGKFSGKKRLIVDLSSPHNSTVPSINSLIPLDEFSLRYHDIEQAVELIKIAGQAAWLAKIDITSAFKVMPIHPDAWHLFGIQWAGKFYFAVRLTFGCKSSPKFFDMLSEAICWI